MYSGFQLFNKYLSYYLRASNGAGHGMHSPFVFDFIGKVLNGADDPEVYASIEERRKALQADGRVLNIEDLGAGSRQSAGKQRTVASIAKAALKPPKYAQLLYRLARHYQPARILELGTSLGLTTAYLSKACPQAEIISIEGSSEISGIAKETATATGSRNIHFITGNFDEELPRLLLSHSSPELVYIDGNHRYEPTVRYFQELLPYLTEHSILIFDDIHWSVEMEQAWREIIAHPSVVYSIDVFFLGFVFFRKSFKVKQDFVIRF